MASGIAFVQWDNYVGSADSPGLFDSNPFGFNSRQERLHTLNEGDRLWLVSRRPDDQQYYFVGVLGVANKSHNLPDSPLAQQFGEYAIAADRERSYDLGKSFAAEGLLRALDFETGKAIRYGASIGQSLQALRILTPDDEAVLDGALERVVGREQAWVDAPAGVWTKCALEFAEYFRINWEKARKPLAFMLYDAPPALPSGAPIFIHADKHLRLVARYVGAQYVAGHRFTADEEERLAERERVWSSFREGTINAPVKQEYEHFFEGQHGVRSLFLMDEVFPVAEPLPFKEYGRALHWGYPTGVGYRYLTMSQSFLLLRGLNLPTEVRAMFSGALGIRDPL